VYALRFDFDRLSLSISKTIARYGRTLDVSRADALKDLPCQAPLCFLDFMQSTSEGLLMKALETTPRSQLYRHNSKNMNIVTIVPFSIKLYLADFAKRIL
jgi:hypothetical protein